MDLRSLRHAVILARNGNFARAAEQLHITQPALSRSIQALERELGVLLFDRGRRGVTATVIGTAVLRGAEDLLRRSSGLELDISRMRKLEIGNLAFGIAPLPASLFLKPVLHNLHANHPQLQIKVERAPGSQLVRMLLAEAIEFFVCAIKQVPAADGVECERTLQDTTFSLFVRPDHPLLDVAGPLPVHLLHGYKIATGNLTEASMRTMRNCLELHDNAELPLAIQCDDIEVLKSLTTASDLILLAASELTKGEIADGKLVELPIEIFKQQRSSFGVFALEGRSLSPAASSVVEMLDDTASVQTA